MSELFDLPALHSDETPKHCDPLSELPLLRYEPLRGTCYIYILTKRIWDGFEEVPPDGCDWPVYIGSTKRLPARIEEHHREEKISAGVAFDRVWVIPPDELPGPLPRVERGLIRWLRPIGNTTRIRGGIQPLNQKDLRAFGIQAERGTQHWPWT